MRTFLLIFGLILVISSILISAYSGSERQEFLKGLREDDSRFDGEVLDTTENHLSNANRAILSGYILMLTGVLLIVRSSKTSKVPV